MNGMLKMNRHGRPGINMLAGLVFGVLLLAGHDGAWAGPLRVVVSTTLLEGIVLAVGGDQVNVTPVIPHTMCPGHFDLSPRLAAEIAAADVFIQHGFETFARKLSFGPEGPFRVVLPVKGNGMIPAVHREITTAVCKALGTARPAATEAFGANAVRYLAQIDEVEQRLQPTRDALTGIPVLAAAMNAPFIAWMGCKVVGTFPRDEGLSASEMVTLGRAAQSNGVRLVVDNQQSLGRTGRMLAGELEVPLIILSNFPSTAEGGYPAALQAAIDAVHSAVSTPRSNDKVPLGK